MPTLSVIIKYPPSLLSSNTHLLFYHQIPTFSVIIKYPPSLLSSNTHLLCYHQIPTLSVIIKYPPYLLSNAHLVCYHQIPTFSVIIKYPPSLLSSNTHLLCYHQIPTISVSLLIKELPSDKTNLMTCAPREDRSASESSQCAHWVGEDPMFLHADSKDSDQTGRMLIFLSGSDVSIGYPGCRRCLENCWGCRNGRNMGGGEKTGLKVSL